MPDDFVKVAQTDEIPDGTMKLVEFGDDRILLANVAGEYHAVADVCSHAYAPLTDGELVGEEVECPLHGSVFNVTTGEALTPPADEGLIVYPVRVEGSDILVGPSA